jgi:KTSC domain
MRRRPVSSSVIASIGYAAKSRVLEIAFNTGRIYQYLDVERKTYDELLAARSKGSYFNTHIRDEYACVRVS